MRLFKLLIMFFVITSLATPFQAEALIPPLLQFGGYPTAVIPCTCTPTNFVNFFVPLYLTAVPVAGTLGFTPASFRFPYGLLGVPATPHLGAFIPGVPTCWQWVPSIPPFCVPFPPQLGVMGFAGTGITGTK